MVFVQKDPLVTVFVQKDPLVTVLLEGIIDNGVFKKKTQIRDGDGKMPIVCHKERKSKKDE